MSEIVKVNRNLIWAQNAIETVYVHNKYSGTLSPGDVVILDTTDSTATEIAVDLTTTLDDKAVFGMALETMATGTYGLVQTKGPTGILKTYGAVSVGSYLSAYGTATYAVAATSGKGGVFAIALESQSSGAQVTDAYLMGGAGRFDTASDTSLFASPTFTGAITNAGDMTLSAGYDFTIAGTAAGTDYLILTTGDILLSDGKLDVIEADTTTTMVDFDNVNGTMGADEAILLLDAGGAHASGSNMLRLDVTGSASSGSIALEIDATTKVMRGIVCDSDCTAQSVNEFSGTGAIANNMALLYLDSDGAIKSGGNVFRILYDGTPEDAGVICFEMDVQKDCKAVVIDSDSATNSAVLITGNGDVADVKGMLEITNTGTIANGGTLCYIHSTSNADATAYGLEIACNATNLEGLYVSAGKSVFTEDVTIETTSKLYFKDSSQYIYSANDTYIDFVGLMRFNSDGAGLDFKIFGGTSNDYVLYDASDGELEVVNTVKTALTVTSTLATTAADNSMDIAVTDNKTGTAACRGLRVTYASAGTHASGGQAECVSTSMTVTNNIGTVICFSAYTAAIANKTVGNVYGYDCYLSDAGDACGRFYSLNLGQDHTNAATESGFIRMRNHGASPLNAAFRLEANNSCTHLFRLGAGTPYHSSQVSVQDGRIAIDYNGTTKYLAVYSS